ncbi:MAG: type II secretion system GspH family protein, partial [Lachnospiraceae bacterium]|nr:type II secretion system GspH family protein [Lachnospiraceae bacterium]
MKNADFDISTKSRNVNNRNVKSKCIRNRGRERRTGDNRGFTLLELLIAVLVLAIVIIPLLHSFVSSFRVNARSRETMRATTLAQNEMELFEKEKIEDLTDPTKFTYRGWGTATPEPDGNGCYTF